MAYGPQLLPEHPFHYTAQHHQLQQRHGWHGGLLKWEYGSLGPFIDDLPMTFAIFHGHVS